MEVNKKIITYHKFSLQEELFLTIECIKASNLRITATRATFAGLCLAIKGTVKLSKIVSKRAPSS